ncbi:MULTISPECIES: YaaL family protein [Aeribacillus]|mgnify:FL=1|jgi:Protein of unknown function (DUF2508).|uniref:DUF2508 domain-containing protein n=3 Tax=Aeribacillus TaxID=1055323 RepID=A0A223E3J1_9BACI|nr:MULTISPECIES: YaaL family protein [Aeribacillus]ASS89695.1 hypothetical protein AP3564_05015 [Aeribacillus pallidus]MED1438447.1 YaaL family protein [Aeribacillus composti]REJ27262.1 MAG: DUF2508 domain-containing protein [Bacillaceae bacterium]
MFIRRKQWLRREFDQLLLQDLIELKEHWEYQKRLVEKSFDPSPEVLSSLKLAEAKYLFLLKEAKKRNIKMEK